MKTCLDCKVEKPLTEFHRDTRKDGHAIYCKPCKGIRVKDLERRYDEQRVLELPFGTKLCGRCKVEKPLTEFGRRKQTRDGYCYCCKPCYNTKAKTEAQYTDKEYWRRWRKNHPGYRSKYKYKYKPMDPAKRREFKRRFMANNPGYNAIYTAQYRARKRDAQHVPYTATQVRAKIKYWGGRCWICKKSISSSIHMDHVKPLSKGGPDCLSNLRPACGLCNGRKSDQWPFAPPGG